MNYDVLIVGTGIAGLYTALNLRDDIRILMITKNSILETVIVILLKVVFQLPLVFLMKKIILMIQ